MQGAGDLLRIGAGRAGVGRLDNALPAGELAGAKLAENFKFIGGLEAAAIHPLRAEANGARWPAYLFRCRPSRGMNPASRLPSPSPPRTGNGVPQIALPGGDRVAAEVGHRHRADLRPLFGGGQAAGPARVVSARSRRFLSSTFARLAARLSARLRSVVVFADDFHARFVAHGGFVVRSVSCHPQSVVVAYHSSVTDCPIFAATNG